MAIVARQDLIYGLGRVFEVLAEETGWEIMITRSMDEAGAWIKKRVKWVDNLRPRICRVHRVFQRWEFLFQNPSPSWHRRGVLLA